MKTENLKVIAWVLATLGVLGLTGYVFTLTDSWWSLVILFFMPSLTQSKDEFGKDEIK